MERSSGPDRICFDVFQADFRTEELRKHGYRLKLPRQSFRILQCLLQRPGEVVRREELQQALWPNDTFVDFEHGLNNAMKRLRTALNDSVEKPRFIETLPRLGYRFIGDLTPESAVAAPVASKELAKLHDSRRGRRRLVIAAVSLVVLLSLGLTAFWFSLRTPIPSVIDSAQITNDRQPKDVFNLVTDGTRVYFDEFLPSGPVLTQVSTDGGETEQLPLPLEAPTVYDISPSRSDLLVGGGATRGVSVERPLWIVPLPAGPPHRVGDILAHNACWAPDGSHLAFVNDRDLFVANADGSEAHRIVAASGFISLVRFSPDGKRLRFTVLVGSGPPEQWEILESRADGTGIHRLPVEGCCGTWSPDGKYYFYQKGIGSPRQLRVTAAFRNVWALPERRTIFGRISLGSPVQLTAGPLSLGALAPSRDGKHLFVVGHQDRTELVRYDSNAKQFVPFLEGISADELEVSPDGQWVTYTTYPDCNLWRSKLDGSDRLQLTFPPINAHEPHWSPDGKQILFADVPLRILVVSAEGGAPHQLLAEDQPTLTGAPGWLPDGAHVLFARAKQCPMDDVPCFQRNTALYSLDLRTHNVSKLPGSEGMYALRVSRDGRYVTALTSASHKIMLYDFAHARWSELAEGDGSPAWSRNSKFVYLVLQREAEQPELVRISIPEGKIERVLDLKDIEIGGYYPGWVSVLPDDSPLLTIDKSTQEIYRLDLRYQ